MRPFANEPALELRRAPVRAGLVAALAELDARLPLWSAQWAVGGGQGFVSTDPGNPDRVVACYACGTADHARAAVEAAARALPGLERQVRRRPRRRPRRCRRLLRERRLELAALQVRECAKPWAEADGDVCEAIDFLEYYAREAVRLDAGRELIQLPGERNTMRYAARGVTAVISPWNFPLAIPCGMVAAALATGNAVVLKPAEQSPASALALVEALRGAGVPEGAIGAVPGFGDAGEALVRDARVHTIAFTGSSAVGLGIVRAAAETPDHQGHVKRVVAEMGGKNCVLVDSDADLDDAVPAILTSAFGYAGQKCSAAARVLAHEHVAEALLERLGGALEVLVTGQAESFATDVPPVIEREAQERIERYVALAAEAGTVVSSGGETPAGGWFCRPVLATGLPSTSPVLRDEIFGPLLTVERVPDMAAACDDVAASQFALTGGLFSRSPATIEEVVRRSPVGNLYVNRNITGAMVGRQPFGGNRRSGIGSKAGGPDYLLQFVEPRVVTESTIRHGLVVE